MVEVQLAEEGFEAMGFENVNEAGDLVGRASCIVIDLMDGGYTTEKLRNIRDKAVDAPILVLRGGSGLADSDLKKERFDFILRRPFSIGRLVDEVKKCT